MSSIPQPTRPDPGVPERRDDPSIHRRRGVALINLMFALTVGVSITWWAADLSWRVWVPTLLVDLFLLFGVAACVIADIREENAR